MLTDSRTRLFHYTSGQGLLGILQTQTLWATQIAYMNDAREFTSVKEVAMQSLDGLLTDSKDSTYRSLCQHLLDCINSIEPSSLFAVCLSEADDSLSQWRGYCPASFGYSIGFKTQVLERLTESQGFLFGPCSYCDKDELRNAVYEWMSDFARQLRIGLPNTTVAATNYFEGQREALERRFIGFAAFMKDATFADEREWRLVCLKKQSPAGIQFRIGRAVLVPYTSFSLSAESCGSSIASVRVGPTPRMADATNSVRQLLAALAIEANTLATEMSYRDW